MSRYIIKSSKIEEFEGLLYSLPEEKRLERRIWNKIVSGDRVNGGTIRNTVYEGGVGELWDGKDFPSFLDSFFIAEQNLRMPSLASVSLDVPTGNNGTREGILLTNDDYSRLIINNASRIQSVLHVLSLPEEYEDQDFLVGVLAVLARGGYVGYILGDKDVRSEFNHWVRSQVRPALHAVLRILYRNKQIGIEKLLETCLERIVSLPINKKDDLERNAVFITTKKSYSLTGIEPIKNGKTEATLLSVILDKEETEKSYTACRKSVVEAVDWILKECEEGRPRDVNPDLIRSWINWLENSKTLSKNLSEGQNRLGALLKKRLDEFIRKLVGPSYLKLHSFPASTSHVYEFLEKDIPNEQ